MQPDAYDNHPLWGLLDNLRERFQELPRPDTADHQHKQDAVGAVIAYLDQYREDDGLLVQDNQMSQVHSNVQSMVQQLQNIDLKSPNWGHLDNAYAQIPGTLQHLNQYFPTPTVDSATAATKRAATMFRKRVDTDAEEFKDEMTALRARIAQSEEKRVEQEQALSAELEAIRARAKEVEEQVATHASRLVKQIEDQRTAFDTATDERTVRFKAEAQARAEAVDKELETLKQTIADTEAALTQAASKTQEALEADAEALVARLREHERTSETLIDSTARNAIAGDYGAWAQKQAIAAFRWTIAAVVFGVATAASLVYALNHASDDSIQFTLYKTGVGLVGLIIAGYCARQAAEHRSEERTAKRLHLDLAALEPFLKQVDDPTELRTEIARRVFVVPQQEQIEGHGRRRLFQRGFTMEEITALMGLGKNAAQ